MFLASDSDFYFPDDGYGPKDWINKEFIKYVQWKRPFVRRYLYQNSIRMYVVSLNNAVNMLGCSLICSWKSPYQEYFLFFFQCSLSTTHSILLLAIKPGKRTNIRPFCITAGS